MLKIEKNNQKNVAIVVVGYKRITSISRLLKSLLLAEYPTNKEIPLILSIDCSGNKALYDYVNNFAWPYGEKSVNIQTNRLGLKKHIYQCGDLTKFFKAIIILEDDIVVSPVFYSYVLQVVDKYADDARIAEISLYKNERNGYIGLPFVNEQNGSDVFLMQDVSTWGQCWTESMWNAFKKWRDCHSEDYVQNIDMPQVIKNWERAWSKYYNAYVVDTHKYILYPNMSLTTNFNDSGEHGGSNNSIVQVNLLQQSFSYRLLNFENLVKYDIYFNNEKIYDWLEIDKENLCLDIYGFGLVTNKQYLLTTKEMPYKLINSFALNMRPFELNIKYKVEGNSILLYDTSIKKTLSKSRYSKDLVSYFLQGFNLRLLIYYVMKYIKNTIIKKIVRWVD